MAVSTSLVVIQGAKVGKQIVFENTACCLVGRARDCEIQLDSDPDHPEVSRHHCLFEIDPPRIWVCDLGSLNGTFVNGKKLGRAARHVPSVDKDTSLFAKFELREGDEVRVGDTLFVVHVGDPREIADPIFFPAGLLWPL